MVLTVATAEAAVGEQRWGWRQQLTRLLASTERGAIGLRVLGGLMQDIWPDSRPRGVSDAMSITWIDGRDLDDRDGGRQGSGAGFGLGGMIVSASS